MVNQVSAISDDSTLLQTSESTMIAASIPTLGEVGVVLLGLLLAAAGLLALWRRQPTGWLSS